MSTLPFYDAEKVFETVDFAAAVAALDAALRGGLDPAAALDRTFADVDNGQLLLMPAEGAGFTGVKLASIAPANPARGLERIQAIYLLMDTETLTPLALLDGTALTTLRTPALSAVAVDHLAPAGPASLLVIGSGPQAWGHVHAVAAVRELAEVIITGRSAEKAATLVATLRAEGYTARVGSPADAASAGIIVCATTASEPVFDGSLVSGETVVVAVGSHEPSMREIDSALMARSFVVIEDTASALREAGDVIIPIEEGSLDAGALVPLRELVTGAARPAAGQPRVFKSTGMGWEDLVVAAEVHRRAR
ncbi:ornithine cyclodeaminase family protein [Microterricola viridarii]|uniref:Ornithine cyclodeaminase n=1 Tax=Microterricola viridarii TaxID=412690 RepID=A0A0Y0MKS7_9MICO|nr:ornithine cyclodeaminase family protein [Microterricola viridarii]AMB57624.1 ornithine cyclodeaminase [Microterricola viridarii]